ncbi:MAG TPA: MJ0042-type zinc finger domain-containing protein [Pseudolabrys sp.]|nr:MJ0042-type zinc finger domain-containing protein [Pseudolabrys sp.]
MLIVCPSCATSYQIEPPSLGAAGRMVRCARCKATWFAGNAEPELQNEAQVAALIDSAIAGAGAATSPTRNEPALSYESETPHATAVAGFIRDDNEPRPAEIDDAPSLVPPIEHAPSPDSADADPDSEDVESFAARRQRLQSRRKKARRSSRWTAIILLLVVFNLAVVGARETVVGYLPQTASLFAAIGLPVNLRQLTFEKVLIKRDEDGGAGLTITGTVASIADRPVKMPRLRFAVRNAGGQETYTWTEAPAKAVLTPGERLDFHTRLAVPPEDAKDVLVRFADGAEPPATDAK